MLTLIKRFIRLDWNLSFFFPCVIDICQVPSYVFFIVFHVSQRSIPMDMDEPLLLVPYFRKKFVRGAEGRKGGIHVSVFCAYGVLYVSWGCLPHARIFNQRKFDAVKFTLRSFGASCLSGWKRSQLVDSKPSNASAVYRKADTVIGYWIIPSVRVTIRKKGKR